MKIFFLFLGFLFFDNKIVAQNNYTEAMEQGDAAFKNGKYKTAFNKYFAAEVFDGSKKDIVKEKVNKTFDAIEALRKKTQQALEEAKKQTSLALGAKKEAEKQKALTDAALNEARKQTNLALDAKKYADSINKNLQEFLSTVIGAKYKGGKIAWKDSTGKHGLIVAEMDMPEGMIYTWDSALVVCNKYSISEGDSTYKGWRLPSKDELNKLYVNKDVVGGFSNDYYWSSSEYVDDAQFDAWYHNFNNGLRYGSVRLTKFRVRAVKAF